MARVKLGFSRFAIAVKIFKARTIVLNMTGNPNFTNIPPEIDLPVIKTATDLLEERAQAADKGGTDKTLAMYIAEAELSQLMAKLQDYVQVASNGDPIIIESSGMVVRRERIRAVLLLAIEGPKANVGPNPGEINVSWDGMQGAQGYVVEMKLPEGTIPVPNLVSDGPDGVVLTTDPKTIDWVRIDTVTKRRLTVAALTTGTVYSFRIAAINSAGQGAYSQTVSSVAP